MGAKQRRRRSRSVCGRFKTSAIYFLIFVHSAIFCIILSEFGDVTGDNSHLHQLKISKTAFFVQQTSNVSYYNDSGHSLSAESIETKSTNYATKIPSDLHCWNRFDFGMLDAWNASASVFCRPSNDSILIDDLRSGIHDAGWLRCRVRIDPLLPPATAPHTM